MGMEQTVSFAGTAMPTWGAVSDLLTRRGVPVQARMIDGRLAFPAPDPGGQKRPCGETNFAGNRGKCPRRAEIRFRAGTGHWDRVPPECRGPDGDWEGGANKRASRMIQKKDFALARLPRIIICVWHVPADLGKPAGGCDVMRGIF